MPQADMRIENIGIEGYVQKEWHGIFGKSDASQKAIDDIIKKYCSPGRFYHTLTHVKNNLGELKNIESPVKENEAPRRVKTTLKMLYLAQATHDAYYDCKDSNSSDALNVIRSAIYAEELALGLGIGYRIARKIRELVIATNHVTPPESYLEKIMVDIDLTIFGKDEKTFFEYDDNIRKEFAWVPYDEYKQRRIDILKRFLSRKEIYHTEQFRNLYESQARKNLVRAIEKLENG